MKNDLLRGMQKSNKRLKVDRYFDSEERREQNELRRQAREYAAYMKRVRQEEEDRNRYIIPEHQDLEEQLTG